MKNIYRTSAGSVVAKNLQRMMDHCWTLGPVLILHMTSFLKQVKFKYRTSVGPAVSYVYLAKQRMMSNDGLLDHCVGDIHVI